MKSTLYILLFVFSINGFAQTREIIHYYNNDSTLIQERFFVDNNNILQGRYVSYYPNQKIAKEGIYVNNNPDSVWTMYYQNGQIKSEGTFENGIVKGFWIYYYENGNMRMKGNLLNNKKNGFWIHYYENGRIKNQGDYIKSKKDGNWKYFHEDGAFKAEALFTEDDGVYIEYYDDMNIKMTGKIVNGKSVGIWKYFYRNGKIKAEGEEVNGIKEGSWRFYYDSGKLKSVGKYDNGLSTGEWKYFHENGQLEAKGTLDGNDKIGYWNMFFPTGETKAEANYTAPDANYTEYYESGKIKVKGQFKNGQNDSTWTYFYEDGTQEGTCNFDNGIGLYKSFYKNGKVKMEGKLHNNERIGDWKLYNNKGELVGIYKSLEEKNSGSIEDKFNVVNQYKNAIEKNKNKKHILSDKRSRKKKKRIIYPGSKVDNKFIISLNPVAPAIGSLPINIEYYTFKKRSHQLDFYYYKTPFFKNESKITFNTLYNSGGAIGYKYKKYANIKGASKPYFAHDFRIGLNNHFSKIQDSVSVSLTLQKNEWNYEYSFLFGQRYFMNKINKHFTADIFLGIGVGYRNFRINWVDNLTYDAQFSSLDNSKVYVPIRLGFSIGYIFL